MTLYYDCIGIEERQRDELPLLRRHVGSRLHSCVVLFAAAGGSSFLTDSLLSGRNTSSDLSCSAAVAVCRSDSPSEVLPSSI